MCLGPGHSKAEVCIGCLQVWIKEKEHEPTLRRVHPESQHDCSHTATAVRSWMGAGVMSQNHIYSLLMEDDSLPWRVQCGVIRGEAFLLKLLSFHVLWTAPFTQARAEVRPSLPSFVSMALWSPVLYPAWCCFQPCSSALLRLFWCRPCASL